MLMKSRCALVLSALLLSAAPLPAVAQEATSWRTVPAERLLVVETSKGRVLVELFPDIAPAHVERVTTLADQGFYDGHTFHRVIEGFMAQTGDPQGTGGGGSDLADISAELNFRRGRDSGFVLVEGSGPGLRGIMRGLSIVTQPDSQMMVTADFKVGAQGIFCPGVVGMARAGSVDSANSQFFFMTGREDDLNGLYTPFGRIVDGLDVVKALKAGSEADNGRVGADPDTLVRVRLATALPAGQRPTVQVLRDESPEAVELVAEARAARGANFNICDVQLPSRVQDAS
ncbi:MAG: peptidylprolyl isomerase [Brevundimonas sp.]|uniref:peptidylprolyl isomerase n=1 Tax=Brevundimonas sp. TaxID=1871086 RepID=UPI002AB82BAF|nr:peptidylprolyl isomerase [Brevundimonas sp.]MDZ4113454.1 peptidylprolyl isomerase [Brevundimonas sp.]